MRRYLIPLLIAALLAPCSGCATVRNTKIPQAFVDLGYCVNCKKVMALDGISDNTVCTCPSCGVRVIAKDAKHNFRRRCADLKNGKTAIGVLSAGALAASIAGAVFGIPIPPPPISEETFTPYEMPMIVTCKKAVPVENMTDRIQAPR